MKKIKNVKLLLILLVITELENKINELTNSKII